MATPIAPHNLEAEKAVLGAIILDNAAYAHAEGVLKASSFYHPAHQIIYLAIKGLNAARQPIDELTLADWLKKDGNFDTIGGDVFLNELLRHVVSEKNVAAYVAIMRRLDITRRMIAAASHIATSGYAQPDIEDYIDASQKAIFSIAMDHEEQDFSYARDVAQNIMHTIEDSAKSDDEFSGLPTGFRRLDDMTGGLQKSDLVIVAARPGMGKTAFALNVAVNAAGHIARCNLNGTVAIFSLEMNRAQIVARMIAADAKIEASRLRSSRNQQLTTEEWVRLMDSINRIGNLAIDDNPTISLDSIRSKCRKLKMNKGLGLVIIDYIQLMDTRKRRGGDQNRSSELGEISRGLKIMARELDVPVVALSQLNRELEKRPDKKPRLSDLRESGSIEQDADVIMFIHREAGYHHNPRDLDPETRRDAAIIVAKQRNGPTGTAKMCFFSEYTCFENRQDE